VGFAPTGKRRLVTAHPRSGLRQLTRDVLGRAQIGRADFSIPPVRWGSNCLHRTAFGRGHIELACAASASRPGRLEPSIRSLRQIK
jgi:hypothetical protein